MQSNAVYKKINLKNMTLFFLILYLLVFTAYPIAKAFAGSLHDWNPLIDKYDFVGLDNFKEILGESLFWYSIMITLIFTFCSVILRIVVGMLLALLLNSKLVRFKSFFRGLFYLPTITPMVAISLVWMWLYNPQFGLIDKIFNTDINWLNDPKYALLSIVIMTVWKDFGYATVIFLSGLLSLPTDVYEASDIDGASKWQQFWKITVPLLKPTTVFIVITSLISYLQTYIQVLVMTNGGPGTTTYIISYLIYDEAFVKYRFGTASAMSIILLIIIGVLTALLFKFTGERRIV